MLMLVLLLLGFPAKFSIFFLLGCLIFVVSFVNTDVALIILIFSMLLSPEFRAGQVSTRAIKVRADDIFLILIFIGWFAKMAINKELGLLKATKLNAPIAFYSIICFVSSFFAIVEGRIGLVESLFYILKYLEYFLLFFLVANNLKTLHQAKKFIFFLLLTCLFVSIFAWSQFGAVGRASAPFEQEGGEPNTFAGYLIIMMSLMIGMILYPESRRQRAWLSWLLVIAGVAFIRTLSRSGWLSFLPVALTFLILNKRARPFLIILIIAGVILLPRLVPKEVHTRVKETFVAWKTYSVLGTKIGLDESASTRIESWRVGITRWVQKPIFGFGIPAGAVIDNQYTRVLNETGIIGFGIFIWLLVSIFRAAKDVYLAYPEENFVRAVTMGFIAGYMGILLLSSAAASFIIIRIMEPFWFLVSIVVCLPDLLDREKSMRSTVTEGIT